ncbi:Peptidase M15 [Cohaesibacter sp. ES.047]|uniref:YcbK family protein n=1 Tax=Cohaesibacter sp. ES.047 TaxID=1798205 RepID=UPI000BB8A167|nr:D-Ala-D-Ala carboxypeptidase family metallohydrolase [Cohaesibacter sp. ES.047]SNY93529.1 Peptidase M15 [Cohaesibacter sp. ES.047]
MTIALRLALFLGLAMLISACQTTTSSVSTHTDLSNRSVAAYAGLETKSVKGKRGGFQVAHAKVQLSCLKPKLVKLLKKVETHYGKPVIITSGYRSAAYNRRVRGARKSQHIQCKAADIRVPGVSKSALAKYAKTLPGIGGVGIYCRSSFVHLDVGGRRDWYWGCGKRRRRA